MSFDRLIEKIVQTQNPSVVGLDPKLEYIPEFIKEKAFAKHGETLKGAAKAYLEFNKGIIDAIYKIVPAVKPQSAFYEALGTAGIKTLHKTCEYAKKRGMYVIMDGKRNDIGSTAEGYAQAYLGKVQIGDNEFSPFPTDALTVNGYLGTDGILPFTEACEKYDRGIFVLVKTSNPSSGELQDRILDGSKQTIGELETKTNESLKNKKSEKTEEKSNNTVVNINSQLQEKNVKQPDFATGELVYEIMGRLCEEWGKKTTGKYGYSAVGVVIGATYPEQIKIMREKLPNTFFLIPGYGAQGGTAEDLKAAFDTHGLGGIVNNSRGVLCAYKKENCNEKDYAGAAYKEAVRMRDDIMKHIGEIKLHE
ncbi:MAG: orotidine-5'-phosphate decarboxylase [Oscillospiraceae bacterium]|nr:orotidine-5'-phosphate decarboxylase [Oscillospiraceae bacterium]